MGLFDCRIQLDRQRNIIAFRWESKVMQERYANFWDLFLNRALSDIADFKFNFDSGEMTWKTDVFDCREISGPGRGRQILLKKRAFKEFLYESTFDRISDGIQIYDRDTYLMYMNQASRRISGIPDHLEVTGRHLMDLYALEEDISTVTTAIRTRRPVINRFDHFKTTGGDAVTSVNTAYPVFDGQELIGAMVFDQNLESINKQIEQLEERRNTIKVKTSLPHVKFSGYNFSDLIGQNHDLMVAVTLARKIARQDCNVLLVGETGTGKEIFAQSIHRASDQVKNRFVAINCAAVPETLIESVFFGTSRGSFTGSVEQPGLMEEADGGILFLDELNSMSLSMQSKLLRVIQEGYFRRLGGNRDIKTNVRFISSCNEEPTSLIERGGLRRDLFYRLSTVTIDIPPLRARLDDIEELVDFYLKKNIKRYIKAIDEVSPRVLELFCKHHWPGNVRELFNVLDYVLNTVEENRIEVKHLPRSFQQVAEEPLAIREPDAFSRGERIVKGDAEKQENLSGVAGDLPSYLSRVEKQILEKTLLESRYNMTRAADKLGISRQNLQYRVKKHGLG